MKDEYKTGGVHSFVWTEQDVEKLKSMWAAGKTASEIKRALNATSRSAVLGKISRLGLKRSKTIAPKKKPSNRPAIIRNVKLRDKAGDRKLENKERYEREQRNRLAKLDEQLIGQRGKRPKTLLDLDRFDCRGVIEGEGATMNFCANTIEVEYRDGTYEYCGACRHLYLGQKRLTQAEQERARRAAKQASRKDFL